MNRSLILSFTGRLICVEAALMLLPLIVSVIYAEPCFWSFIAVIGIALAVGVTLCLLFRPKDKTIYAREGFIIVGLSWLTFSAIGALPFVLSGEIPFYIDAFFETVSGFTTTGASILSGERIESMYHGTLFWRSFTHWIGGMGILVFVVAMTSSVSDRSIHILKAEMPGPTMGKLVPKLRDTAKILYLIYIGLTLLEMILLFSFGMPLFDSIVHTFGTAGTGGFGIKGDSITSYGPALQWIITIFMMVFGLNFNVYYFILVRRFKDLKLCTEAWTYLGIIAVSTVIIVWNISPLYNSFGDALRHGAFQVGTIISTTGYATQDFNLWPSLSKAILLVLMFVGSCANSTAGGLKISRVIILFKSIKIQLMKLIHPRSVNTAKFEGKTLDDATLTGVRNYFALYMFLFFAMFLIVSIEPFSMETNFSAVTACFNNIGPGFDMVGASGNYAAYSPLSKIVLSLAMLLGRLEIFPILLTLIPTTWKTHK